MFVRETEKEVLHTDKNLIDVSFEDIAALKQKALANDRKRIRLCSHKNINDKVHEMLIIHSKDAYVCPHKHLNKSESIHVIEGIVDILLFSEQGDVTEIISMGDYASGRKFYFRMSASKYHTLIIRSEWLVFHETTGGPFVRSDTVFAPWAPRESDATEAREYFDKLTKIATDIASRFPHASVDTGKENVLM